MDKQAMFLCFSKLIKISRRKKWMLLIARSNSFTKESDAKPQTGEQYSKQGKINS